MGFSRTQHNDENKVTLSISHSCENVYFLRKITDTKRVKAASLTSIGIQLRVLQCTDSEYAEIMELNVYQEGEPQCFSTTPSLISSLKPALF